MLVLLAMERLFSLPYHSLINGVSYKMQSGLSVRNNARLSWNGSNMPLIVRWRESESNMRLNDNSVRLNLNVNMTVNVIVNVKLIASLNVSNVNVSKQHR
jgi:hypothetical protein